MRLTVGPLPPAVYWRRRAVVLGALLAVVLVVTYSCSSEAGSKGDPKAKQPSASPSPSVSSSFQRPTVETPPTTSSAPAGTPTAENPPGNSCADSELSITPAPETQAIRAGMPTKLYLKIRNMSARTCTRDVGADVQELYLHQNGQEVWSSDCNGKNGNDVVTFPPDHEKSYFVNWDARGTDGACTAKPALPPGSYQLYGRLGNKVGGPVPLTIVG